MWWWETTNKRTNTFFLFFSSVLFFFTFFLTTEKRHSKKRCRDKILGEKEGVGDGNFLLPPSPIVVLFYAYKTHTHTHTQCSLYNPKSPAPRSSPKLSPTSNNDPPSSRRRLPTAKVRVRGENNFSRKKN